MSGTSKLLIALVALAALGAGSATAARLITGKQVKDKSLTGADVRPRSVGADVLTKKARASLRGQRGARGRRGPSTAYAVRGKGRKEIAAQRDRALLTIGVPRGAYTIMAKAVLLNTSGANASPNCQLVASSGGAFEALDQVNDVQLGATQSPTDTAEAVLMGFAGVDGGANTFQLRCTPSSGETFSARDRVLIATRVGALR